MSDKTRQNKFFQQHRYVSANKLLFHSTFWVKSFWKLTVVHNEPQWPTGQSIKRRQADPAASVSFCSPPAKWRCLPQEPNPPVRDFNLKSRVYCSPPAKCRCLPQEPNPPVRDFNLKRRVLYIYYCRRCAKTEWYNAGALYLGCVKLAV